MPHPVDLMAGSDNYQSVRGADASSFDSFDVLSSIWKGGRAKSGLVCAKLLRGIELLGGRGSSWPSERYQTSE